MKSKQPRDMIIAGSALFFAVAAGVLLVRNPVVLAILMLPAMVVVAGSVIDHARLPWILVSLLVLVGYAAFGTSTRPELGGVTLDPADIVIVLGLCWAVMCLLRADSGTRRLPVPLLVMVVTLALPLLIGLAYGREIQGVLRDAKPVAYFLTALALAAVAAPMPRLSVFVKALVSIVVVAAGYHLVSYVFGWSYTSGMSGVPLTTGVVSRGYGLYSAYSLYGPVGLWLLLRDEDGSTTQGGWVLLLGRLAGGLLIALALLTLIRSLLVGMVLAGALAAFSRRKRLPLVLLRRFGVAAVLATAITIGAAGIAGLHPQDVTERALSIVLPNSSSTAAAGTLAYRVSAITDVVGVGLSRPFGLGYGDAPSPVAGLPASLVFQYGGHSAASWLLLRTGVIGLVVAFGCMALFVVRGVGNGLVIDERVLCGMILASYAGESFGSNGWFANPWSMGVVALILIYLYGTSVGSERSGSYWRNGGLS